MNIQLAPHENRISKKTKLCNKLLELKPLTTYNSDFRIGIGSFIFGPNSNV